MNNDAERIDKHRAAAILGCSPRAVVAMAAAGKLPSAAKLTREWTFAEARLRDYVRAKEMETCQAAKDARHRQDATGAVMSSGAALRLAAGSSAGRLKQMMRTLRKDAKRLERQD